MMDGDKRYITSSYYQFNKEDNVVQKIAFRYYGGINVIEDWSILTNSIGLEIDMEDYQIDWEGNENLFSLQGIHKEYKEVGIVSYT